MPSPPPTVPPVTLAAGAARLGAKLIDLAVILVVHLALRALIDNGFDDAQPSTGVSLLTLVFVVLYEVGMVATRGGTVGKLALGLRVVDQNGTTPPPVRAAAMRWSPNLISIVPIVGPLIALALVLASLLWVFTDPAHRSIFDRTGLTFVALARPSSPHAAGTYL